MPQQGDVYTITLKETHLNWGTHRYTNTRDRIYGEGYIPIPRNIAIGFGIYNSNYESNHELGVSLFRCVSSDGNFDGFLKASGSMVAGDEYAKQFQGLGDLKALGSWFSAVNAQVGDQVKVEWTSSTDVVITLFQINP